MQLTIDLTNQPEAYGKRVIAVIEAFYGIQSTEDDAYRRGMQAARNAMVKAEAAAGSSVPDPLPLPTLASVAQETTPSAAQVASSQPPAESPPPSVDSTGLPWDARIHSSSKAINADGTWRKRKGLNDDGLVKRIEGELRAVMAVPAAPVETAPIPLPPPVIPAPSVAPAVPTAPPPAPAAAIPTTLAELMPRITGAMVAGTLPNNALLDAVNANGIPDLPTLAHRPDLIPQVWSVLQQTYPGVLA